MIDESLTYEKVVQRMTDNAKKDNPLIDTREGSITHQNIAPVSMEVMTMNAEVKAIYDETFIDTASRERLILRGKERGLTPKPATKALVKGEFTPTNIAIPIGSRFSLDKLNYVVTRKITDGYYELECETFGEAGNDITGTLIPIEYIYGLATAKVVEVLILGEDEEDTESFRKRCLQTYTAEAYGGNKADYKWKVGLMNGVGGVKVYSGSEWNGGGTVKIVITDSQFGKPTETLIGLVQEAIDPLEATGEGIGIAPIGHFVSVVGVNEETINIASQITYQAGYDYDMIKAEIEAAIDEYFRELNEIWEDSNNIVVRISHVENRLLNLTGILDIRGTSINGYEENWQCAKDSIAKRGTFNA